MSRTSKHLDLLMKFKQLSVKSLLIVLLMGLTFNSYAQVKQEIHGFPKTDDEFVGPFKSWLNAKTGFGAKGDGKTDDTKALQSALNAAAKGTLNSTLFLPAGTYLITGTLTINYHINISFIGADPATTIIKWAGAVHGTMLQVNGTAYSKFNRVTFNGNRVADGNRGSNYVVTNVNNTTSTITQIEL